MSPEKETWKDARTRLQQLNHEVEEAQEAVEAAPADAAAKRNLEMIVSIRDVAEKALVEAKRKLDLSASKADDDN
jgi:hypothetical protein